MKVTFTDMKRTVLHEVEGPKTAGLHVVNWGLRRTTRSPETPRGGPERQAQARPGELRFAAAAPPGTYQVILNADGKELVRDFQVVTDPEFPSALLTEELEAQEEKPKPQDTY